MPKNQSASQFFDERSNTKSAFLNDIMDLTYTKKNGTVLKEELNINADEIKNPLRSFEGDYNRIFTLEQDENKQWKRVSLVEKYGMDILQSSKIIFGRPEVIHELYDLVEEGNLYFYNRGSDVPLQYKFKQKGDTKQYNVMLGAVKDDPRFDAINAERREQSKDEVARYEQYLEAEHQKTVIAGFGNEVKALENARARAHKVLSVLEPGTLEFLGEAPYTVKPMQYSGGSKFTPEEMELIVLASCDTAEAAAHTVNKDYVGATAEELRIQNLSVGIHQDVMIEGRNMATESMMPVFEKGREIAAELIQQEMDGNTEKLKQTLMNSLRNHIQSSRDSYTLGITMIRLNEETAKLASFMDSTKFFADDEEFKALNEEAKAMGLVAKIYTEGEKAKQELLEAHKNGKFESEKQRLRIVGQIEAERYITARTYQSISERAKDPDFIKTLKELEELSYTRAQQSTESYNIANVKLYVKQNLEAKQKESITEFIDGMRKEGDASFKEKIQDYMLLTTEGRKLQEIKDPFKMIEAMTKLPKISVANCSTKEIKEWMNDFRDKRANNMSIKDANQFWLNVKNAVGNDQFEPELLSSEHSRLIIQQPGEGNTYHAEEVFNALKFESKDMKISSLADTERMEMLRDQIAQGNVFFYKRGETVPHRLSLDEEGMPTIDEEPVQATRPGLWARFANFITGGRAYREEIKRYEQERALRDTSTVNKRESKVKEELDNYQKAVQENKKVKEKASFLKGVETLSEMSKARERAHKVLSLDAPEKVSFVGNTPNYVGKAYAIPDAVKGKFTSKDLDALCLAGITSTKAAEAHMKAGFSKIKGSTPESTVNAFQTHIYNDILIWGRDNSEVFFPWFDAGRQVASDALNAYANDQPKQMAELLGNVIKLNVISCRTDHGVQSNLALANEIAMQAMDMLEKDKALKNNCGIDAKTLAEYKQELKGLHMVGEAYEKNCNAQKKLAEAVKEGRNLTKEESIEIATDMLTYQYLNTVQINTKEQLGNRDDIMAMTVMYTQLKVPMNKETGEKLNPFDPKTFELQAAGMTRDYYFSGAEKIDMDYEIKQLYTKPSLILKGLANETYEHIRELVQKTEMVANFGEMFDKMMEPMKLNKLINEKSKSKEFKEVINQVAAVRRAEDEVIELPKEQVQQKTVEKVVTRVQEKKAEIDQPQMPGLH